MDSAPYRVALVLDPNFGERLRPLAAHTHVWAVGSNANRALAQSLWASGPQPPVHNNESGVTPFDYDQAADPEQWFLGIVGTIDQHHDECSHDPGYSLLEVIGLQFRDSLWPELRELGFREIQSTELGFVARKALQPR